MLFCPVAVDAEVRPGRAGCRAMDMMESSSLPSLTRLGRMPIERAAHG